MGWITTHRAKGITNDEWFSREALGERYEVVVSSTIKGVYYAAVRTIDTGEVWAYVALTQRAPRSYHNFGWKSMEETMGPCEAHAPAKVLDALTETDNEHALEWRARCRKSLATAKRTLDSGTEIELPEPLGFQLRERGRRGWTLVKTARFVYAPQERRPNVFRALCKDGSTFLVTLPDWRSYSFEVK